MTNASAANPAPDVADSQGMTYLVSLPRRVVTSTRRSVSFLLVLLFPVLLDGDHGVQAGRGTALARGQSVLGHESRRSRT